MFVSAYRTLLTRLMLRSVAVHHNVAGRVGSVRDPKGVARFDPRSRCWKRVKRLRKAAGTLANPQGRLNLEYRWDFTAHGAIGGSSTNRFRR